MNPAKGNEECTWESPLGCAPCGHEPWKQDPDGRCIFHSRCDEKWDEFEPVVQDLLSSMAGPHGLEHFSMEGWVFPREFTIPNMPYTILKFAETEFGAKITVNNCRIQSLANVVAMRCRQDAKFVNVRSAQGLHFVAHIDGECQLDAVHLSIDWPFAPGSVFQDLTLINPQVDSVALARGLTIKGRFAVYSQGLNAPGVALRFSECSFKHFSADLPILEQMSFEGCHWRSTGRRFFRIIRWNPRPHLEHPKEEISAQALEERYRHFRKYYEERGVFDKACDFSIGEMDCKIERLRQDKSQDENKRRDRWFLWLYGATCRYGNSALRPLALIVIMVLILAGVTLIDGLRIEDTRLSYETAFGVSPSKSPAPSLFYLRAFLSSGTFIVASILRLTNQTQFRAEGFALFASLTASVLGPVLIALVVFVLRRRSRTLR